MASSWASLSAAKHLLALWIVAGHMDLQLLVVVVAEQVVNQRRSHRAQATVVGGVASFDDLGIPEVDFPDPRSVRPCAGNRVSTTSPRSATR
jgi:hypothetical protein